MTKLLRYFVGLSSLVLIGLAVIILIRGGLVSGADKAYLILIGLTGVCLLINLLRLLWWWEQARSLGEDPGLPGFILRVTWAMAWEKSWGWVSLVAVLAFVGAAIVWFVVQWFLVTLVTAGIILVAEIYFFLKALF